MVKNVGKYKRFFVKILGVRRVQHESGMEISMLQFFGFIITLSSIYQRYFYYFPNFLGCYATTFVFFSLKIYEV